MTREELIKKVALKMDEISSSDDVIVPVGTGDNNPLYTQINNLLNESVNDVLMKAPIFRIQNQVVLLEDINIVLESIFGGLRKIAVITVPEDLIRVASITDTNFQRPIVDLSIEGDEVDNKQHNRFLVAKSAKPVAVIGRNKVTTTITNSETNEPETVTSIGRVIRCYSYDPSVTTKPTVQYVKRYDNDRDTTAETDLDDYMIDVVSWVCAGKVFAAQGDVNKGKICDDNAASLMI